MRPNDLLGGAGPWCQLALGGSTQKGWHLRGVFQWTEGQAGMMAVESMVRAEGRCWVQNIVAKEHPQLHHHARDSGREDWGCERAVGCPEFESLSPEPGLTQVQEQAEKGQWQPNRSCRVPGAGASQLPAGSPTYTPRPHNRDPGCQVSP